MSAREEAAARQRHDNLKRLLSPRHIAFIGGQKMLSETIRQCEAAGFAGEIWPVNPNHRKIGERSCWPSVRALPRPPDAAFIAVPREATVEVVRELAATGAGGCVCYAAGFAEVGDGVELQQKLIRAAGEDLALVGPNCYGLINYVDGAALWPSSFGGGRITRGVAFISQSGNIALNLTMSERSVPFAYVLSVGNQAVLSVADYVEVLAENPHVTAIGLYLEGLTDIPAFGRAALRAFERDIPLVALKTGRSPLGSRLTLSHTSSLAGDDRLYDALFDRFAVTRVNTLPSLLETLKLFSVRGRTEAPWRPLIFTCSGGDSLLVADAAAKQGVELPEVAPREAETLRALLPDFATISNPLDYNTALWGDRLALQNFFTTALQGEAEVGMLVIDYPKEGGAGEWDASVEAFVVACGDTGKAGAVTSTLPELLPERIRRRLIETGVAPLQGVEEAVGAIAAVTNYALRRGEAAHPSAMQETLPAGGSSKRRADLINESASKRLLAAYGITIPEGIEVKGGDVRSAAGRLGYPVVIKLSSPAIAHKTEAGAVVLGVRDVEGVAAAVAAITASVQQLEPPIEAEKFLVERHIDGAVAELIVGVRRDDHFGLALVVGSGGVLVELASDAITLLLPATRPDIERAVMNLRGARLMSGYRNRPAGDIEAAVETVFAVCQFAMAHRNHLIELDINPLLILPKGRGVIAADALIVMDSSEES